MKNLPLKTLLAPALLLAVACEDIPTAPISEIFEADQAVAVGELPSFQLTTESGKSALLWTNPLSQDISVAEFVSKRGGTVRAAPGIDLVIPENAVSKRTEISVLSRAGEDVAFEFGPHGLQFNSPVTVRINVDALVNGAEIRETAGVSAPSWSGMVAYSKVPVGSITAIYYTHQNGEVVEVIEEFPVYLEYGMYLTFETDHFSGYALAA